MIPRPDQITLIGGPSNGIQVDRPTGRSLLVFDSRDDQQDHAQQYRQGRNRDHFTYRGMTRIVAQMPAPGATNAS